MKKYALFLAALSAFCACTVESLDNTETGDETITLEARFDDGTETRTERQSDGKVFWLPGDQIGILRASGSQGGVLLTADITEPSATATFSGKSFSTTTYYWALYPYNPDSYYDSTYGLVTELPAEQDGVAGSFADDLFISVGYAKGTSVTFYHLCGGVKFTVTDPDICKATLVAAGDEMLAGLVGIKRSNSLPYVYAWGDAESIIELYPEEGTFTPGEAYHFVTLPATLSKGFSIIFERADGKTAVKKVSKSVEIKRAHFATLLEADKGLAWKVDELEYSPDEVEVSGSGEIFSITVQAFGNYHVDVDPDCDWIIPLGVEGLPIVGATHSFKALRNPGEMRMGLISVCNAQNCFPVLVTQNAADGGIPHHSLGMRFTATWCGWCPFMNESFYKAKFWLDDHFEIVNLHASSSDLAFAGTNTLASQYKVSGYPTGIVDGRVDIDNSTNIDVGKDAVVRAVLETEATYPTVSSIGLSSTVSGQSVTVEADVYTQVAGDYKLTVMLLENGIVKAQASNATGTYISDYVHDNIARVTVSASVTGDAFTTSAGETRHFSFPAVTVPDGCNIANMTVLGYVQRTYGTQQVIRSDNYGDYYIDNCRLVPIGTAVAPEVSN